MKSVDTLNVELEVDTRNRGSISGDVVRSAVKVETIDGITFGVWEVTPGVFEGQWTGQDWEVFTVISGAGTFTTEAGEIHELVPGAMFVMRPGTRGVWEVTDTLRKTFAYPEQSAERR
ncbi:MAG: cupin domain-containing protein [Brooklawnia sp.]|jgi:uncharacterized cupin superfamily protein